MWSACQMSSWVNGKKNLLQRWRLVPAFCWTPSWLINLVGDWRGNGLLVQGGCWEQGGRRLTSVCPVKSHVPPACGGETDAPAANLLCRDSLRVHPLPLLCALQALNMALKSLLYDVTKGAAASSSTVTMPAACRMLFCLVETTCTEHWCGVTLDISKRVANIDINLKKIFLQNRPKQSLTWIWIKQNNK